MQVKPTVEEMKTSHHPSTTTYFDWTLHDASADDITGDRLEEPLPEKLAAVDARSRRRRAAQHPEESVPAAF